MEFDAVQRAYGLLTSPERRARYDATGDETEQDPASLLEAQARGTVAGKLNALIGNPEVNPAHFDVVIGICELIEHDRRKAMADIAQARSNQDRLRQFEKRLKRKKKEGADRVRPMITAQIEAIEGFVRQKESEIRVLAAAKELATEYTYAVEAKPQDAWVQMRPPGMSGWR